MANETNVTAMHSQTVSNAYMVRNGAKDASSEPGFKAVIFRTMQKDDQGDSEDSAGKTVNCTESIPEGKNEETTKANGCEPGVWTGQNLREKDVQSLTGITAVVPMNVLITEIIPLAESEVPASENVMRQTALSAVPVIPVIKADVWQTDAIETMVSDPADTQTVLPAATSMEQPQHSMGNIPENLRIADPVSQNRVKIQPAGELPKITEIQTANTQEIKQILQGPEAGKTTLDPSLPELVTPQKINDGGPVFFSGDAGIIKPEPGISKISGNRNSTFLNLMQDFSKETAAPSLTQRFESNSQTGENSENLQQNAKSEIKTVIDNDVGSQMPFKSSVSADFAVAAGKPEAASTGQPHSTVETQIVQQIKEQYAAGKNEFEMQLSPENLGKITVKMTMKASSMVIEIVAANKEVQNVISSGSAELRSMLQNRFESPVNVQIVSDDKNPYFEDHSGGSRHQRNDAQQENREDQTDENQTYTGDFLSLMELIGNVRVN